MLRLQGVTHREQAHTPTSVRLASPLSCDRSSFSLLHTSSEACGGSPRQPVSLAAASISPTSTLQLGGGGGSGGGTSMPKLFGDVDIGFVEQHTDQEEEAAAAAGGTASGGFKLFQDVEGVDFTPQHSYEQLDAAAAAARRAAAQTAVEPSG